MHTHEYSFSFSSSCVCHEIWNAVSLIMKCACSVWGGRYLSFFSNVYICTHNYTRAWFLLPLTQNSRSSECHTFEWFGLVWLRFVSIVFVIRPLSLSGAVSFVCSIPSLLKCRRKQKPTEQLICIFRAISKNNPPAHSPIVSVNLIFFSYWKWNSCKHTKWACDSLFVK